MTIIEEQNTSAKWETRTTWVFSRTSLLLSVFFFQAGHRSIPKFGTIPQRYRMQSVYTRTQADERHFRRWSFLSQSPVSMGAGFCELWFTGVETANSLVGMGSCLSTVSFESEQLQLSGLPSLAHCCIVAGSTLHVLEEQRSLGETLRDFGVKEDPELCFSVALNCLFYQRVRSQLHSVPLVVESNAVLASSGYG